MLMGSLEGLTAAKVYPKSRVLSWGGWVTLSERQSCLPGGELYTSWQGEVPVMASTLAVREAVLGSFPRGPSRHTPQRNPESLGILGGWFGLMGT